jgi:hypothetical protein
VRCCQCSLPLEAELRLPGLMCTRAGGACNH